MPIEEEGANRRKKKGTSGNGAAYETLKRFGGRTNTAPVTWGDVSADAIRETIAALTAVGDAIVFSRSYDAGVLVLTVLHGQERPKFYAKTVEEAESILADIENASSERNH